MRHSVTMVGGHLDGQVLTTDQPVIEAVHHDDGHFKIATYYVYGDVALYQGSRDFYDHPDSNRIRQVGDG